MFVLHNISFIAELHIIVLLKQFTSERTKLTLTLRECLKSFRKFLKDDHTSAAIWLAIASDQHRPVYHIHNNYQFN